MHLRSVEILSFPLPFLSYVSQTVQFAFESGLGDIPQLKQTSNHHLQVLCLGLISLLRNCRHLIS